MPPNDQLDRILSGQQESSQDSLDQILFGGQQPQQQTLSVPERPKESPISNLERLRLGFADDKGRESELRKKFNIVQRLPNGKFAVGNNPNEVNPIDPEGLFNDVIGDIADVLNEIPVIAGQIGGAILGTAGGPGGTILGGAAGAGTGEAARIGIGRTLGIRESTALEEATDIAIVTAFGAAGEALIPASKFLGRKLVSPVMRGLGKSANALSKANSVAPEDTLLAKNTARTFKILSNVPEESTLAAFKYGIEDTLGNPRNLQKKTILSLVDDVISSVKGTQKQLGKVVGDRKVQLIRAANASNQEIQVGDMAANVFRQARELNLVDDLGNFTKTARLANKEDLSPIRTLLSEIADVDFKKNIVKVNLNKTISAEDALRVSKIFGDKFDKMSVNAQRIIKNAMKGDDIAGIPGLRPKLRDLSVRVGVDDFARVMDDFSNFMNLKEELTVLNKLKPARIESFIERLENIGEWNTRVLERLDKFVVGTGQKSFIRNIEMWNAAQDFTKANPNLLRFNAITAALGSFLLFPTDIPKPAIIGGAVLLGTPAGSRAVLRSLAKAGSIGQSIPRTVKGKKRDIQRQLLNALVSTAARQQIPQR